MNERIRPVFLRSCLLTALSWLCALGAIAQTTSAMNYPAGAASVAGVGTVAWTAPTNILNSNGAYAAAASFMTSNQVKVTDVLSASNYGFSIPTDATVSGIEVSVQQIPGAQQPVLTVTDTLVRLLKSGSPVGTDHSSVTPWPGSPRTAVYGADHDLWGTTWTPAEINAADFGAGIVAKLTATDSGTFSAYVDAIFITVYYTTSGPSITRQPLSQTVCAHSNTIFSIAATGATSYQWQTDSATGTFSDLSNNAVYSNVTRDTLIIHNAPVSYNGYKYRCKAIGATSVTSDSAMLTINTAPEFNTQPADATGCPGNGFTFSSSASAPAGMVTYRWQVDNGYGFVNISDTNSLYATAGTDMLRINHALPAFYNNIYRLSATNGCGVSYSGNANLQFPASTGNRDFTGNGNWNDPSNWTPCGIPLATETITIDAGDSTVIPAGYNAVAKGIWIAGGLLTIQAAGTLTINDVVGAGIAASPGSRIFNHGNLTINNTGYDGIYLDSAFWNNTGTTEINNVVQNGVFLEHGSSVINSGNIFLGNHGTMGERGIFCITNSTMTNTTTGLIRSDSVLTYNGLEVQSNGVFTNNGTIYTGTNGSLNEDGLYMYQGNFINNGVMNVANTRRAGVQLIESTLTNKGQLNITNTALIGIYFSANSTAVNDTSGAISINQVVNGNGLINVGSFTNKGLLEVGSAGAIARIGFSNEPGSTFINRVTGRVVINDIPNAGVYGIFNRASFQNQGTIKIGNIKPIYALGILLNSPGTFTNDTTGLIEVNNILERDAMQLAAGTAAINYGTFRVGNSGPVNRNAIFVAPASGTASFVNAASGIMELDNVPNPAGAYGAITIRSIASFTNNGVLKIGLNTACRAGFCGSAGLVSFTNNGTIVTGNITSEAISGNVILNNNNGGTVQTVAGGKLKIAGELINNNGGTITNHSTGTMTVDSLLNNSGTVINNGTLKGHGTIAQNGTFTHTSGSHIAPGNSPGTLTINGDFNLGNATLDIEADGPVASSQYDVLRVTGNANISNASLHVMFGGSYLPGNNDVITFLDAASVTGTMGSTLPGGMNVRYNYPSAGRASLGNATALPVKLLSFGAQKIAEDRNLISFASADEGKGVTYEVTRSHNGIDFKTIGTLTGNGNGSSYTFYDKEPLQAANYYRLAITEATGKVTYSNIAVVQNGQDHHNTIIISPVPAAVTVTISSTDAALNGKEAIVSDLYGKEVHRFLMSTTSQINVAAWPSGTYLLRLPDGKTVKLIKQ